MYKRCNSATQEADLAEDLVVDRETFGWVTIICFLDEDGGVDLATTARIRSGRSISRAFAISDNQSSTDARVYVSCVRISIIYRSKFPHS